MKDMTACREILTTPLWVIKCCQLKNWAVWANWSNSDRLPLCFHVFSLNQKTPKRIHVFSSMSGKGGEEGRLSTFAALFIINPAGWRNLWRGRGRSQKSLASPHCTDIGSEHNSFPDSHIVTAYGLSDCHWGQSQYSLGADMNRQEAELIGLSLSPMPMTGKLLDHPSEESLTGFFLKIIIRNHLLLPRPKENKSKAFLNLVPICEFICNLSASVTILNTIFDGQILGATLATL